MTKKALKNDKKKEKSVLEILDEEITLLNEYLEKHKISGLEYDVLTQPLVDVVDNFQFKKRVSQTLKKIFTLMAFIVFLMLLWQISWPYKLLTVVGRNLLLLILPVWDWTRIYYSDCILTNPFYSARTLSDEDCNVCESLDNLERLSNVLPLVTSEEFLSNDLPFIVIDAMNDWNVMNTEDFWFDNVTELYLSDDQMDTRPCELTTNLRIRPQDLQHFLRRIHDPNVHRWYGHWENCDKKAAKALRPFYKRPYFIPSMVDLSDSNWVLLSSDYKGKVYKQLEFNTELLWIAQVRGWNHIRLLPREPCDMYCPELIDTITEGQMLVLTNLLWRFEYIPGENTDNLAVAVGGDWN